MSFQETLEALDAEEKAMVLTAERYEAARKEWLEIETRYVSLRANFSDDDALSRITDLVRRYGSKVANRLGYPGIAAAAVAFSADDGAFTGFLAKLVALLP